MWPGEALFPADRLAALDPSSVLRALADLAHMLCEDHFYAEALPPACLQEHIARVVCQDSFATCMARLGRIRALTGSGNVSVATTYLLQTCAGSGLPDTVGLAPAACEGATASIQAFTGFRADLPPSAPENFVVVKQLLQPPEDDGVTGNEDPHAGGRIKIATPVRGIDADGSIQREMHLAYARLLLRLGEHEQPNVPLSYPPDHESSDNEIEFAKPGAPVRNLLLGRANAILACLEAQLLTDKVSGKSSDDGTAQASEPDADADGISDFDTVDSVEELGTLCRSLALRARAALLLGDIVKAAHLQEAVLRWYYNEGHRLSEWTRRTGVRMADIRRHSSQRHTTPAADDGAEADEVTTLSSSFFAAGDLVEVRDPATGIWLPGRVQAVRFSQQAVLDARAPAEITQVELDAPAASSSDLKLNRLDVRLKEPLTVAVYVYSPTEYSSAPVAALSTLLVCTLQIGQPSYSFHPAPFLLPLILLILFSYTVVVRDWCRGPAGHAAFRARPSLPGISFWLARRCDLLQIRTDQVRSFPLFYFSTS